MENTENKKIGLFQRPWFMSLLCVIVIFGSLGAYIYWQMTKNVVAIENSYLDAPIVRISPSTPGMLNALYVQEDQRVNPNEPVALIGSETLYTKEEGIVSSAPKVIGSYFAPGQTVVSIIANQKLRAVGTIEESKGLAKIAPGQRVVFTVDAFGAKKYEGVVDEVGPASNDTGIAFSISDKRPVKKFDVYVRFDISKYPELKTGMSARMWVHVK